MVENIKREASETPANTGRRQAQPRPQDVAAAAVGAATGQHPSGPHAHPGQRVPPLGTFPRPHVGQPVPVRGLVNTARIPPANSPAAQADVQTPAVPRTANVPITPRTMTRRPATVPTPATNVQQPSIAQIGAARNALTAAATILPAGTPAFGRELLVRYIAVTNHAVAPAHAMANMMRANWDINVALNRYMAQQAGESSSSDEDSDEEGEGDTTQLGDPEPDELPVDEHGRHQLGRPKTNLSNASASKETKIKRETPKKNGETYAAENAGVDRSSARRSHPDDEKLTITLTISGVEKTFKWGKSVSDWDNPEDIERLNRWRQQVFRRWLGPIRHRVVPYHPQENAFLIDRARAYHNAGQSNPSKMNWVEETKAFNDRFAGKTLPDTDANPRPARSKGSLTTQIHRIPEVGTITGTKIRGNRAPMTPNTPTTAGTVAGAGAGVDSGLSAPASSATKHRLSTGPSDTPSAKTQKPNPESAEDAGDEDSEDEDSDVPDTDSK